MRKEVYIVNDCFSIVSMPLQDLVILKGILKSDNRGSFERLFCSDELRGVLSGKSLKQINFSKTNKKGTVRGMHFQFPPATETKIVKCIRGTVFDVAVDIRHSSPTYLQWHGVILSEKNHKAFVIPEGFAHGFQTLCDDCELLYLHTALYCQELEGGLNPVDPSLSIQWPKKISLLSEKDKKLPYVNMQFIGIDI